MLYHSTILEHHSLQIFQVHTCRNSGSDYRCNYDCLTPLRHTSTRLSRDHERDNSSFP